MSAPLPGTTPVAAETTTPHWICIELGHQGLLPTLCGEPTERTEGNYDRQPEHLCPVCQLLARHHSVNCPGCAYWVQRWGL